VKPVKLKTFFVEDNPTIRDNLVETLEELTPVQAIGFADDEATAVLWLHSQMDWQLAIVDLFLLQGSGLGVVAAASQRRPDQKVVVLSNYATTEIRRRCLQLGADAVFDKSDELDDLIAFCIDGSPSLKGG
jgi:DNA-binding NarL/FixJ family response regulator